MTTPEYRADLERRSALASADALWTLVRRIYAAAHGLRDVRCIGDRLIVHETLVETVAALFAGATPHIECPGEYAGDGHWTPHADGCATCLGMPMLDVLRETVALRELVGEMHRLLVATEWGYFGNGLRGCHDCFRFYEDDESRHCADCALAAAITKSAGYAGRTT